jgi:hypothetical protein
MSSRRLAPLVAAVVTCLVAACSIEPAPANARTLEQLVDTQEPGIDQVRDWIRTATNPVEVLAVDRAAGERSLVNLQITSRSPMGAVALETGGILIAHGWIRVLGSGHARLPRGIDTWNDLDAMQPEQPLRMPRALLVGDDALGGFFALDGGGIAGQPKHVFYFAPDTLQWEHVADSYSEWLTFLMNMDLTTFYGEQLWPGWENDARQLPGDRAFSVVPFLWAKGPPIAERSRRPVPIEELWGLHVHEFPQQLGR